MPRGRPSAQMEVTAMVTTGYLERDIAVGEIKLHYQEWGSASAPVVLMLHGFGVSGHMFDEFAERMQDRYRLIALDQRGHGDSDWSSGGDYTREAFVADVEGFVAGLGLEQFVLVGHSMGGLNAVSYTVKNPERVRALILVDVGPEAAKEGVDNIVRFTRGPDELQFEEFVEMAHRFNPRRTMENIRERMRHRLKPLENGKWTWKFDKRFRDDRESLRIGGSMSSDETWQLFRAIRVPTLLVRGAESDVLSADVANRAVAEMPRARLVVVSGAGHSVPGDNPDEFTVGVREFLADVEQGRFEPAAALEPPPLGELMEEHENRQRKRVPVLALVLVGVTTVLALGGASYAVKRQRDKKVRAEAEAEAQRRKRALMAVRGLPPIDVERARQRAAEATAALSLAGKTGVRRAKRSLEGVDVDRARAAAQDLLAALGETAKHSPETARAAVQRLDRTSLSKQRSRLTRRGSSGGGTTLKIASRAVPFALMLAGPLRGRRARKSHRVMRWRN